MFIESLPGFGITVMTMSQTKTSHYTIGEILGSVSGMRKLLEAEEKILLNSVLLWSNLAGGVLLNDKNASKF